MIDLEAARQLLDFEGGGRIARDRAEEQLRGAVAIHNILRKHRVAYLADEVGMGKTYVALGALALFRHFDPSFRVLVIAPRENIQRKWQKELRNFTSNNVKVDDLRVRAPDGRPGRPLVNCGNLIDLVNQASLDPNRDFFLRMTSFSLPLGGTSEDWKRTREGLRRHLPWLSDDAFDLRNKEQFKKNFARAVCCALPKFDLVIVDEAHNFKHGFSTNSSARNRVLGEAFGRYPADDPPSPLLFPGYGPRAERVLMLSATPLEESYRHIWNQLDLFGLAGPFGDLKTDALDEQKKKVAAEFLVRRVTSIRVGGREHTKNMYRREWRGGGVAKHDEPIRIEDERQRLVVALVQKKVSELLSGKRFNQSFQIGMLASFESFLETARLKRDDDESAVFDGPEQTDVLVEREGMDVRDLNRLARDYAKNFDGRTLPHPKMDAVVDSLAMAWKTGEKALVFVRRVASVKELKRKLDERYDDWLLPALRERLPEATRGEFDAVVRDYRAVKLNEKAPQIAGPVDLVGTRLEIDDTGGNDTFFAWFFRGEGPKDVVSGANIQGRFIKASGAYATFFADNYVMDLLGATPGSVVDALATTLGLSRPALVEELRKRAARYLTKAKRVTRAPAMEAAQAAALELLRDQPGGPHTVRARIMWEERYRGAEQRDHATVGPPELASALERTTFFTELRRPQWEQLRAAIWPVPRLAGGDDAFRVQFREQELRAQFLATAARLGHAFIDLYVAAMVGRTTLTVGRSEDEDAEQGAIDVGGDERLLGRYLDTLEAQRVSEERPWAAFRELAEISENFALIIDTNASNARPKDLMPLSEAARYVASLLRQQHPVGGMAGQVNQTLVRQFRMPGYPFVLVTTDLLQEGEDLHTFCSSVHHYGISWTPSAMEQRIGRIDRVRSQTDRRLSTLQAEPQGEDWLQVYFPYLEDTVEVLQVDRVLERMNTFLRLMHEGLAVPQQDQRKVDVGRELLAGRKRAAVFRDLLKSAFPIPDWATVGSKRALAVSDGVGADVRERFAALGRETHLAGLPVAWAGGAPKGTLLGTASLPSGRGQPFMLVMRAEQGRAVVQCVSPVGRTDPATDSNSIAERAAQMASRVGAILTREDRSYDLTVEDDVLLGTKEHDATRVGLLVQRVVHYADWMEREHFGDAQDAHLSKFEEELRKEGGDGD